MDQSGSTGVTGATSGGGWVAPPPPASHAGGGFNFKDFLTFKYLITPVFMTVIYIIGAIGITLGALGITLGFGGPIVGLVLFIFGNLYWRIFFEFIMVLFSMNGALQSIDRRGKGM